MGDGKRKPPQNAKELLERYAKGERDFSGADLSGADFEYAVLTELDLSNANLSNANFERAELGLVTLVDADLREAIVTGTNLSLADLRNADLAGANLSGTNLAVSDLTRANVSGASFSGTILSGTALDSFNGAYVGGAHLDALDLSPVDLNSVEHIYPSSVDLATIELTAAGLAKNPSNQAAVEAFFRGCGLEEHAITYFRSRVGKRIKYHSVFISYSSKDKEFARRLYDALQAQGIRCWLDEHQILPGDRIRDAIDRGIKLWDKVVLCCSESSLESWWVEEEIERALQKEARFHKDKGKRVGAIVPLTIDDYIHDGWKHAMRATIRSRSVADFRDWKNHDSFEAALEVLVKALRADAGGREEPPESRL